MSKSSTDSTSGFAFRYAGAILGPAAVSGVQFSVSLVVAGLLSQSDFGLFSLAFVLIQFSFGLSNALLGTTLTIRLNAKKESSAEANLIYFAINLVYCCVGGTVVATILFCSGSNFLIACLFALLTCLMAMRWFARSVAYAKHEPSQVLYSDLAYAVTLAFGLIVSVILQGGDDLTSVVPAYLAASSLGLMFFGRSFLQIQFVSVRNASLRNYVHIWRDQTRFTLAGVVASEIIANAPAYVVTALSGPDAFATLAVGGLLMRPVMLLIASLTQLERPTLAQCLVDNNHRKIRQHLRYFRRAMLGSWLINCILIAILFEYFSELVLNERYDPEAVFQASLIWMLIALLRAQRASDSTYLQALGEFRLLAMASIIAAPLSLGVVIVLELSFGPIASLWGVLAGETVYSMGVWRLRHIGKGHHE